MDKVRRGKDIEVYDVSGEMWVRAGTGGISTFAVPGQLRGTLWRLDAGYNYGDLLLVWNDSGQHWSWEPNKDMSLIAFEAALRETHTAFTRV